MGKSVSAARLCPLPDCALPDAWEQIADLERRLHKDAWSLESLRDATKNADRTGFGAWIAAQQGQVVGYLLFWRVDAAELLRLGVDKAHQRRGIGRALMQAWLLTQSGEVFLEVQKSNRAAQSLYASLGFVAIHERKNYYAHATGDDACAVVMQKTR